MRRINPLRHPREAGSVYIVALLVLVLLTIFGLSLSFVTQTEMQIGSNERTITRTFYATDAAVELVTARVITRANYRPETITLNQVGGLNIADQVRLSPTIPILDAACNLCQINQGASMARINHAVTARAVRTGVLGSDVVPLAQTEVSLMIEMQPVTRVPDIIFVTGLTDPNAVKIKF